LTWHGLDDGTDDWIFSIVFLVLGSYLWILGLFTWEYVIPILLCAFPCFMLSIFLIFRALKKLMIANRERNSLLESWKRLDRLIDQLGDVEKALERYKELYIDDKEV
jgi:hypothetical protein